MIYEYNDGPSLSNKVDKAIERVKMIQQKLDRRIESEADMSNHGIRKPIKSRI